MHGLHSIAEVNPIACSIAMVDVVDVPESSDSAEYSSRRFSLSHQASFEKQQIEGLKRKNTLKRRKILEATLTHDTKVAQKLNDEGIELIFTANSKDPVKFNVLLCNTGFFMQFMKVVNYVQKRNFYWKKVTNEPWKKNNGCLTVFLPAFLKTIELHTIVLNHIESRPSISATDMDVLAECEGAKENVISCFAVISEQFPTVEVSLYKTENQKEVPWFPRHISDLDKCSHCITKYEPTTDPRHPGFGDLEYIARREELNNQAIGFKHGDMIPYIQYTESEHATWRAVFAKLEVLHAELACEKYRRHLKMLLDEGVLSRDRIPQLRDVNKYLEKKTGFILRPCSGLLSARDFLASLAFRVFQATQYIRHSGSPHHSPEPDLIHELLGHVPMFADADLAQMSQDIGLMSLGASDEQIEKLATVYWFIVEFGLCREDGKLKAIGAGLLSAYGELQHACSDVPEHRDFLPNETALQKYQDDDYQPLYYVAEGIQEALLKLRQYAKELNRPFNLIYDPYTRSILEIKEMKDIEPVLSRFKLDFSAISNVLQLLPEQQRPFMKQRPVS